MTFIETIPHACADKTLASKVVVFLLETFNSKACATFKLRKRKHYEQSWKV